METSVIRIPKLKGSNNWDIWSIRMEAVLCDRGYLDVMTPATTIFPEGTTGEEIQAYTNNRQERSIKASTLIRLALEDGPLIQTRSISDYLVLWNRLKSLYKPKGFSSEFLTYKELFNATLLRCNNSIKAYLTKIKRLTDDLAARDLAIPNKVIAAYTLNNLTPEYEHTVAIISQSIRSSDTDIDLI
jgi:gag-polypeptide of LTR copia-type